MSDWDKATNSGRMPETIGTAPAPIDPSTGQHKDHWVLPKEDREKGFIRPVRKSYRHEICNRITSMPEAIAETYARNPDYYGQTFCCDCRGYYPVGLCGEFQWLDDGSKVGS